MNRRTVILGGTALVALGACSSSKFKRYNGPEVTYVVVNKEARRMYLLHHDKVLEDYDIKLGFAPIGHKQIEGDGRTPEGIYLIDRRNPNSQFHLSLGISYPNDADRAYAKSIGKEPGGDIFIHGQKNPLKRDKGDWTWGCISVTNKQMEDIYAMVRDGTPIQINP
ncbi:L,D-transpeptidase family protein [Sulfitobacter mediterraneus]|jgi:murein L,D-transpeptidase YafK|uniref:L,D-transpeptidase family protein n=1 Tax=Sulfitobacter TaxID=60136 RepID=UPI00193403C8|nr:MULTISPECIES: L,D-transpeptidase family protein [Sulfitobacter]MBM1632974.1 L,D-transpeptidase family protein [Sulfitobacter mediterraneus]MBM1640892.1 L,D-transpeptidase family protein [Sulfitobacter mediterraneus]MBM1644839.1 L,D-transpeptidase family protein [Sulfitobacter mediterraneus]MBM1649012.1 L,D-transpeptidase family protein [Sulfitobacter mediterraneus]MBM1653033.1 L,D-transpeptidase family protein [Sulfitobacter mediterraneus]